MCLLIVAFRVQPGFPLVVAGNRDEWLARPAHAMEVLQAADPRILGGRDLLAGGTWLATNQQGGCAGLTNQPFPGGGRDPSRRSRGELPMILAGQASADQSAKVFADRIKSEEYNSCWILFGDRDSLWYVDLSGKGPPSPRPLRPGLHVLENNPIDQPSPKTDWVHDHLVSPWRDENAMVQALRDVLRSHEIPRGALEWSQRQPIPRPIETLAPCVHAGPYGTRSATLVLVPEDRRANPQLEFTEGAPCTFPFKDATTLWSA
jgi:uncharacterized protein with NRDE domain